LSSIQQLASPGDARDPNVVLPVIAANPALISFPGAIEIVAHAIGAVVVLGLWARLGTTSILLTAATLAGIVWMSVDIIDNAITYHVVPILAADHAAGNAAAGSAFGQLTVLTEGIRFGAHLAGGLWMTGVSAFALRSGVASPIVAWVGLAVGAVFAANLFVPALLNVSFMTVPAWLAIFGVALARSRVQSEVDFVPRMLEA
jgi:hypothetical protein